MTNHAQRYRFSGSPQCDQGKGHHKHSFDNRPPFAAPPKPWFEPQLANHWCAQQVRANQIVFVLGPKDPVLTQPRLNWRGAPRLAPPDTLRKTPEENLQRPCHLREWPPHNLPDQRAKPPWPQAPRKGMQK